MVATVGCAHYIHVAYNSLEMALVSQDCHDKLPQAEWLDITEIY